MALYGDYHTHTIYSRHNHAKGTILDNAIYAQEKGLKEIAISDHGFSHKFYGVDRKKVNEIKKEIEIARQKTGVNVLFGIEENILSYNGDIGVIPSDFDALDILTVGYHRHVKYNSFKDKASMLYFGAYSPFKPSKSKIEKNTLAVLKALDKYPINILSHPGVCFPVDLKQVAKCASQKGTYFELNGKRNVLTRQDIDYMIEQKVKFILNSDAHTPDRVGEVSYPMTIVLKNNIPKELIVNLDNKPDFKAIK